MPTSARAGGYAMLVERLSDVAVVPVLEQSRTADHRPMPDNFPPTRRGGPAVAIPALSPVVRGAHREAHVLVSSTTPAKTKDGTTELWGWIRRTFVTFPGSRGAAACSATCRRCRYCRNLPRAPTLPPVSDPPRQRGRQFNPNGRPELGGGLLLALTVAINCLSALPEACIGIGSGIAPASSASHLLKVRDADRIERPAAVQLAGHRRKPRRSSAEQAEQVRSPRLHEGGGGVIPSCPSSGTTAW